MIAKRIGAILLGLLAANAVIFFLEYAGHTLFPPTAGLDPTNKEQFEIMMKSLPIGAFVFLLLGYFLGSLVGAFVTTRWSNHFSNPYLALSIGTIITIFTVVNFMSFPHPLWFKLIAIWIGILGSYIGYLLAKSRFEPNVK